MLFSDYFFMPLDEITDQDLMTVERCGCCGGRNTFCKTGIFRNKPEIHFVKCKRCRAVTYDRMLKPEKLDEVYESYSYLNEDKQSGTTDQITFYGKERFARHLLKLYGRPPEKEILRILDFGGGDGALSVAFAEEILNRGKIGRIEITVVDYPVAPCLSDRKEIAVSHVFPLGRVPEDTGFDITIASAVLEHLPKPGKEFRQLVQRTTVGGSIYFRTPYKYPLYRALSFLGITLDMRYPRHIWDLGSDWWERIPGCLHLENQLQCKYAGPSVVEKSFREHFFMALAAYMLKFPGYIFKGWHFVGGWETLFTKK